MNQQNFHSTEWRLDHEMREKNLNIKYDFYIIFFISSFVEGYDVDDERKNYKKDDENKKKMIEKNNKLQEYRDN